MRNRNGSTALIFGLIAIVLIAAIAIYQYQRSSTDLADELIQPIDPAPVADLEPTPVIPEATIPELPVATEEAEQAQAAPLPTLDNSDDFVRQQLSFAPKTLLAWLQPSDLLRRAASYIDGLSRGVMLHKVLRLSPPSDSFTTHKNGEQIWLNAGNYERYDDTVTVITALDMNLVADIFHKLRPLLTSAFAELGYKPRQMDGLILRALDIILETPVIVEPVALEQESVAFVFADAALESLLPIQKQLLRAGPDNTRKIQQQAKLLKEALLNPAIDTDE